MSSSYPSPNPNAPEELDGLHVTVDRVIYEAEADTPPAQPHCFVYHITIHNDSDRTVTIKGRKWVVINSHGEVTAVEGSGVVGQYPVIEPGDQFTYNSYHLLDTRTAYAEGAYLGMDEAGCAVLTRIPSFRMEVPVE